MPQPAPPFEKWPSAAPPGLVAIETRPQHPGCTGAVVHNADGLAYVLTAGHCIYLKHEPNYVAVVRPEGRPQQVRWWRHQVTRVLSTPETTAAATEEEQTAWESDWAILEMRSAQALPVVPLLDADQADTIREQAAAGGLSLDEEGSPLTTPTPSCRLVVPPTSPDRTPSIADLRSSP